MSEYIANNKMEIPSQIHDFGEFLATLRNNQGDTQITIGKKIGLTASKVSSVERSESDLPPERKLRLWLNALGCGKNVEKIVALSRHHTLTHSIKLKRSEPCNPDIVRIIAAYRAGTLTPEDKQLMILIARPEKESN